MDSLDFPWNPTENIWKDCWSSHTSETVFWLHWGAVWASEVFKVSMWFYHARKEWQPLTPDCRLPGPSCPRALSAGQTAEEHLWQSAKLSDAQIHNHDLESLTWGWNTGICLFSRCSETLRYALLGSDLEKYCESLEGKYKREKISDESTKVAQGWK